MSIFDIGSATAAGLQSSSTAVATSLVPKQKAHAADLKSLGVTAKAATSTGSTSSTSSSTSTSAAGSSTITSNDFLTLLVSELKNQDPTQPTDPNAYISQLVGVNSLQQLISINQGVTSLNSTATSTTTPTTTTGHATTQTPAAI